MSTASEELWDAIAELVIACGGSPAGFDEEMTAKVSAAVERIRSDAWDDGVAAADGD